MNFCRNSSDRRLGDRVRLIGFVSDEDLRALYSSCQRVHLSVDLRGLWTAAVGGDGVRRTGDRESGSEHKRIRGANCFGHGFE